MLAFPIAITLPSWPVVAIGFLAVLGALTIVAISAFLISEKLEERRFGDQFEFNSKLIDRGTAIPDYTDDGVLREIADHHEIEAAPSKVQRERRRGLRGGAKGTFEGSAEDNLKTTHEPHDNLGELSLKLLRKLLDNGELSQGADRVYADELLAQPIPFMADSTTAREFFESWLEEHHPDGLDGVSLPRLASELSRIGHEIPQEGLRQHLRDAFASIAASQDSIIFCEGEWAIEGDEEDLLLTRTDLRVTTHAEANVNQSIPMPTGCSITARLQGGLTSHGRRRMIGVTQPIRASIIATLRQYEPDTGCFEIAPISVFQRIG
jgi:hypothetical protein